MGKLGDKAKEMAVEHVKRKAAKDILNGIGEWRGNRIKTAKRRWIFELIQNAVDTAKSRGVTSLEIEINESEDIITFEHYGGYFTLDEINAVIYGGSTKPYDPESEYGGRFGTGFLVSHVVSCKVEIEGFVWESENDGHIYEFKIEIDREGDDEKAISQSIEKCFQQLNDAKLFTSNETGLHTKFSYILTDDLSKEATREGIEELKENIGFVFAFNDAIKAINIKGEKFYREIETRDDLTIVKVGREKVYTKKDDDDKIQIGILINDEKISDLNGYPKIFIGMPLTETADYITIPFVINSIRFDSTPERNALSLDSEINDKLLRRAFELYEELLTKVSELKDIKGLFNTLNIQLIPDRETSQNQLWKKFNNYLIETFTKIMNRIPLVDTPDGRKAVKDTIFPLNELNGKVLSNELFEKFYGLISQIKRNIPWKDEVDNWRDIAEKLKGIDEFKDLIKLYDIENLKDELVKIEKKYPTFEEFNKKFELENSKKFLLALFEIFDELYQNDIVSESFIDKLLPDQTGIIGPLNYTVEQIAGQLNIDKDIPEELKDIFSKVGWKIKQKLVDKDFAKYEIVTKYVRDIIDTDKSLEWLINNIKLEEDKLKEEEWDESIIGWINLFWWCVKNNKLVEGFPIITKNKTLRKIETLDEEIFIIPFNQIDIEEKYEMIYPESRIVHQRYFENENLSEFFIKIQRYKVFVTKLPVYKKYIRLLFNKLNYIISGEMDISKVEHEINTDEEVISVLPFWNEVIGKISEDQDRAKLLFEFICEYLIDSDNSWKENIHVSCSCKEKKHNIIPSRWLASLKSDLWVPYLTGGEEKIVKRKATKESIENLLSLEEIEELIKNNPDNVTKLLPHFGFDELDLIIKLSSIEGGQPEESIRKEVSKMVDVLKEIPDLSEIAISNPSEFKDAFMELKEKLQKESTKDENKKIGENVEKIIKKILSDKGFTVKSIYKGGDLEIWPEDIGWDSGLIEIKPYLIEVKFTSSNSVHLSKAQSKEARKQKENYIVLVVENFSDLREQLKEMDENSIPNDLISMIETKSRIIEKISIKLGDLPNPEEIEPDIHGYWIKKKLWTDKNDLISWVEQTFDDGV